MIANADLDSAVALLELAGHPHILGREAFALLQGAACTHAAALAVSTPTALRIVESAGWNSEADARAAIEAPAADLELLPLGRRGDETWTLAARPNRDLEPFCTFASIRKLLTIAVALENYRRDEKQRAALWPADALDADPDCVWVSEQMAETLTIARRIAPTTLSVLLTGETGTGKEMVARAIHRGSDRAGRPFVAVQLRGRPARACSRASCSATDKGAFTGADTRSPGRDPTADGGTLFLDEIGELGAGPPAEAPALARDRRDHAARRAAADHRRRARDRRDQRRPRTAGRRGGASARTCSTGSTSCR